MIGFGGVVFQGAVIAVAIALAALVRRDRPLLALAMLGIGAMLAAASLRRDDLRCRSEAALASVWQAVLVDDARPGSYARARLAARGCAVPLGLLVAAGEGRAGATVVAHGAAASSTRGLFVRRAALRETAPPGLLARLRAQGGRSIDRAFAHDAPLVRALLIADTRGIPPEIRDRFAASGLVHMLSISGLHVGLIALAAQLLLRAAGASIRTAGATALATTVFYVVVIGAPAPAVRAVTMLSVALLSTLLQRPTSPWASLAAGALVPLVDPRTILDLGYQLSVAGIAALIGARSLSRRWVARHLGGWRYRIGRELLAGTLATAVSAPLVAWTFGRVSLIGPVSNLLASPIMALLQPTLFLALLAAPVPPVASFFADAAHPMLLALDGVARLSASVPGASLDVAPTRSGAVAAGVAVTCLIVATVSRFPAPAMLGAMLSLATLAWLPLVPPPHGSTELHLIDVGQGDAVALRSPRGRWVLFDAGGAWRGGDAGRSTVIPYLRRRGGELVAVVLSHPHTDHVGGVASVVRSLRPREFWDAAYVGTATAYRSALAVTAGGRTTWRRVHPGDSLIVDGIRIDFLAPDSAWASQLNDPNEASAVAMVRAGSVRFLLVGDAERAEEDWLLRHAPPLGAQVLKVAHHGSRTSTSEAFLAAVGPRIALVSVGAGNRYGHPSEDVMARLSRSGADVMRSDQLGHIVVRTDGLRIEIEAGEGRWDSSRR